MSRARAAIDQGAELVLVRGMDGRGGVADLLAVAEQVRLLAGVPVAAGGSADEVDDLALGVLAGRADAALFT